MEEGSRYAEEKEEEEGEEEDDVDDLFFVKMRRRPALVGRVGGDRGCCKNLPILGYDRGFTVAWHYFLSYRGYKVFD